ncbi:MAG: hypothetical protein U0936_06570 [Planctomycetaceae bacterium]
MNGSSAWLDECRLVFPECSLQRVTEGPGTREALVAKVSVGRWHPSAHDADSERKKSLSYAAVIFPAALPFFGHLQRVGCRRG